MTCMPDNLIQRLPEVVAKRKYHTNVISTKPRPQAETTARCSCAHLVHRVPVMSLPASTPELLSLLEEQSPVVRSLAIQ